MGDCLKEAWGTRNDFFKKWEFLKPEYQSFRSKSNMTTHLHKFSKPTDIKKKRKYYLMHWLAIYYQQMKKKYIKFICSATNSFEPCTHLQLVSTVCKQRHLIFDRSFYLQSILIFSTVVCLKNALTEKYFYNC